MQAVGKEPALQGIAPVAVIVQFPTAGDEDFQFMPAFVEQPFHDLTPARVFLHDGEYARKNMISHLPMQVKMAS